MGFYKTAFLGFLIPLILTLLMVAYIIYNTSNSQDFPPSIPHCPDYYSLNDQGNCVMETSVYNSTQNHCKVINPTGMKNENKKSLAYECGISWDGITTNSSI